MHPLIPITLLSAGLIAGCSEGDDTAGTDDTEGEPQVDTDGDGLFDDEEAALGTDPLLVDTDGDGFSDYDEVQAGTDPLWIWSHVYTGGYNVGNCEDGVLDPTGPTGSTSVNLHGTLYEWEVYQPGDVVYNFTMTDQHGEEVSLYSFCGRYVMITFSAFW